MAESGAGDWVGWSASISKTSWIEFKFILRNSSVVLYGYLPFREMVSKLQIKAVITEAPTLDLVMCVHVVIFRTYTMYDLSQ